MIPADALAELIELHDRAQTLVVKLQAFRDQRWPRGSPLKPKARQVAYHAEQAYESTRRALAKAITEEKTK